MGELQDAHIINVTADVINTFKQCIFFFLFFLSSCFGLWCLVTTSTDCLCGFSGFIGCKLARLLLILPRKMKWESLTSASAQLHTKKEAQSTVNAGTSDATKSEKIKSFLEEIHPYHHSSRRNANCSTGKYKVCFGLLMSTFSSWTNFLSLLSSISTSARL